MSDTSQIETAETTRSTTRSTAPSLNGSNGSGVSSASGGTSPVGSGGNMDDLWVALPKPAQTVTSESLPDRVRRIRVDVEELETFYSISVSPGRHERLRRYFSDELKALFSLDFEALGQSDKVDFLLLRNFLRRKAHQLYAQKEANKEIQRLIPFAQLVTALCEARRDVDPLNNERVAQQLDDIARLVNQVKEGIDNDRIKISKTAAFRASKVVTELRGHLHEFHAFYASYDPMFDWWATAPWKAADEALSLFIPLIQSKLAGMHQGETGDIIGEPLGREALLAELEAEMIPYTPEQLITLAKEQFHYCELQMKAASEELGYGDNWKKALDSVKKHAVPPGEQTGFVKRLVREGAAFVKEHDLVTVPPLAEEASRMTMMTPDMQRVAPFFLGGPLIMVAYPTAEMPHELKKMVMRGNNRHFARATAFHEMIPGHRLQLFMSERHNSHRQLFRTPFSVEGWAMYWEYVFWDRGDFFESAEDRIGAMFWRMHRCARIVFSLKFHLGLFTPQECIDLLVEWVGHERSTAEAEVRRSFNGDYGPLYQAGYMLGALQLFELRREILEGGHMSEKEFNDAFLKANYMPIELFRALVLGLELHPDYLPNWKFAK
ncbi:hypothetical protein CCMA1212_000542 [Trichoderma ghanense]|uniref:X-Pro dipeptidyl-peptidase n=1 Tax=Trichoderma ghanense TaxID=65468 RepID=A0ABY2HHS9_9HYPO